MTTSPVSRVPAGVPTGGQFATVSRLEARLSLSEPQAQDWPSDMSAEEITGWTQAGFSADEAAAWHNGCSEPWVYAAHWRTSGFDSDGRLTEPGYRPLVFDDSPRAAYYGPRDCCTTEHPMLNRANTTHLFETFTHPEVYLEPHHDESYFSAGSAYVSARIVRHDGTQVGWVGREVRRDEDGTWSLENHQLLLGDWSTSSHALLPDRSTMQGRGIGSAVAAHIETEMKRLVPELSRVTAFSVDDIDALHVGGYQNARRGFGWDTTHEAWNEHRRAWVRQTPRQQMQAIWAGGGRDRIRALLDDGHITDADFAHLETLMSATSGKVPTPRELSELGETTPFTRDGHSTHLGKELLVGAAWHGAKAL